MCVCERRGSIVFVVVRKWFERLGKAPESAPFTIPRIIYSLWVQGRENAPPIVRLCFDRWAELNPGYELQILDQERVDDLMRRAGVRYDALTPQALSDAVRTRLLLNTGGVWADATVLPMAPLDEWLPEATKETGFFAFERPGPDRPISSWFIATSARHFAMKLWWDEIARFWSKPRQLASYSGQAIPEDPVGSVSAGKGADSGEYPYFWFHYLFQYLLEREPRFAAMWAKSRHCSADGPHSLQFLFRDNPTPSFEEIADAAARAPVQKLNWRVEYPIDVLTRL